MAWNVRVEIDKIFGNTKAAAPELLRHSFVNPAFVKDVLRCRFIGDDASTMMICPSIFALNPEND